MAIILYLCLLLLSGAPAFLYAAPPESAAPAAELELHRSCDPTFEGNGALRALLDPRRHESARGYCRTYISAPIATITAEEVPVIAVITVTAEAPDRTPVARLRVTTSTTVTETITETTITGSRIYTNYQPNQTLLGKRAEPTPSFVSEYPASQISSACSCVLGPYTSTTTMTPFAIMTLTNTLEPDRRETETVTATTTITETTTTTQTSNMAIPTLCDPKTFKSYRSTTDSRDARLVSIPLKTKEDCCVACFNSRNCIYWLLGTEPRGFIKCHLRIITEDLGIYYPEKNPMETSIPIVQRDELCPFGVEPGSGMYWPGSPYGAEYGPCLARAPMIGFEY